MRKIIFLLLFTFLYAETIPLTPQEKKLLNTYPFTCISTGSWAPFNVWENHKFRGIGFDYWNLIRKKLDIENGCTLASNWTEVLDAIKNKKADITVSTQATKDRLEYAVFSKPYVTYPIVIATRSNIGFIHDIDILKDKKIAIGKGYTVDTILKENYPDLNIIYVESIDEALQKVENGEVFATLEILPVLAYKINKETFNNLKISGSIPYNFSVSLMFRKDYAVVVPLINKAIDAITKEEKNMVNERWLKIHHTKKVFGDYFYILLIITALIIGFFLIWLFFLKKEISKKEKKERELKMLVRVDSLTKVFNRYMIDRTLDKEILLSKRYNTPLSIIFFDIDGFKSINDTYGHKIGDYVLKELSEVVSNYIRKSDIFGRWGGDEFLIILIHTKEEDAETFAKSIENKIAKHDFIKHIPVTCTFGVTSYEKKDNRSDMINRVDKKYYQEKDLKIKREYKYATKERTL